jgi:hypothetical protein
MEKLLYGQRAVLAVLTVDLGDKYRGGDILCKLP